MREAVQRWAIKRVLNVTRAFLASEPTPARIRTATARAAHLVARRESYEVSVPFEVGEARAHWVQPTGVPTDGVILYFHVGGFIAESTRIHDPLLAALARAAGARGFMMDYRLAPGVAESSGQDDACFTVCTSGVGGAP